MSEPWTKYQSAAPSGPWSKYQKTDSDLPPSYGKALEAARKSTKGDILAPVYQGATLGFGKDIDVLGTEAETGLENFVRRMRKEPIPYSAEEAGRAVRQVETEEQKARKEKHPIATGAEELGGALLTPGVGLASRGLKALGVTSPVVRAMTLGAGLGGGAAAGQSEGTPMERLSAAPAGALAGAVTGGALHGAGRLAQGLPRILGSKAAQVSDALKPRPEPGEVTPLARREAKKAAPAMLKQMAGRVAPEKLRDNEAEKLGFDITAAEAMGPGGRAKLAAVGRQAGQTPEALYNRMWDRIKETPQSIVDDFSRIAGVDADAAAGNIDKLNQSLKAKTGPAYEAFYNSGPIQTPEITGLLNRPAGQKALKVAEEAVANRGISPNDIGFQRVEKPVMIETSEGMKPLAIRGQVQMQPSEQIELKTPTPMALDFVKRALDDMVESYRDPRTKQLNLDTAGKGIQDTRDALRGELTNPEKPWGKFYSHALEAGGEPIRIHEAFYKDAPKMLSTRMKTHEFDRLIRGYEAKEGTAESAPRKALQAGVVSDIREMAERGDVMALKRLRSDETKRRLGKIFTPEQADELSKYLNHRIMLLEWAKTMLPSSGSRTSADLAAMEEGQKDLEKAMGIASAALTGRARVAMDRAIRMVAHRMDAAQGGIDEAVRDVQGSLLMQSPSEFLRSIEAAGASEEEAKRAAEKLTEVGWFAPRLGGAIGGAFKENDDSLEP